MPLDTSVVSEDTGLIDSNLRIRLLGPFSSKLTTHRPMFQYSQPFSNSKIYAVEEFVGISFKMNKFFLDQRLRKIKNDLKDKIFRCLVSNLKKTK